MNLLERAAVCGECFYKPCVVTRGTTTVVVTNVPSQPHANTCGHSYSPHIYKYI